MKKILIAEDDFFIRDIYNKIFSLSGYEVVVASDGLEALEKVKEQSFDILLLDIMTPKLTGVDVLRTVRKELTEPRKNTPIFLITNLGQEDVIEQAFQLGMDGYIIKSQVNPQQVVNEINTFFKNKEEAQPTATTTT